MTRTSKPEFLSLHIDINPVPASRPRVTRWGAYYGKTYAAWRKHCREWLEAWKLKHPNHKVIAQPMMVHLHHSVQKAKTSKLKFPRGDVDNYSKAVLDALVNAEVMADDNYVLQLHTSKAFSDNDNPVGTHIQIYLLNQ